MASLCLPHKENKIRRSNPVATDQIHATSRCRILSLFNPGQRKAGTRQLAGILVAPTVEHPTSRGDPPPAATEGPASSAEEVHPRLRCPILSLFPDCKKKNPRSCQPVDAALSSPTKVGCTEGQIASTDQLQSTACPVGGLCVKMKKTKQGQSESRPSTEGSGQLQPNISRCSFCLGLTYKSKKTQRGELVHSMADHPTSTDTEVPAVSTSRRHPTLPRGCNCLPNTKRKIQGGKSVDASLTVAASTNQHHPAPARRCGCHCLPNIRRTQRGQHIDASLAVTAVDVAPTVERPISTEGPTASVDKHRPAHVCLCLPKIKKNTGGDQPGDASLAVVAPIFSPTAEHPTSTEGRPTESTEKFRHRRVRPFVCVCLPNIKKKAQRGQKAAPAAEHQSSTMDTSTDQLHRTPSCPFLFRCRAGKRKKIPRDQPVDASLGMVAATAEHPTSVEDPAASNKGPTSSTDDLHPARSRSLVFLCFSKSKKKTLTMQPVDVSHGVVAPTAEHRISTNDPAASNTGSTSSTDQLHPARACCPVVFLCFPTKKKAGGGQPVDNSLAIVSPKVTPGKHPTSHDGPSASTVGQPASTDQLRPARRRSVVSFRVSKKKKTRRSRPAGATLTSPVDPTSLSAASPVSLSMAAPMAVLTAEHPISTEALPASTVSPPASTEQLLPNIPRPVVSIMPPRKKKTQRNRLTTFLSRTAVVKDASKVSLATEPPLSTEDAPSRPVVALIPPKKKTKARRSRQAAPTIVLTAEHLSSTDGPPAATDQRHPAPVVSLLPPKKKKKTRTRRSSGTILSFHTCPIFNLRCQCGFQCGKASADPLYLSDSRRHSLKGTNITGTLFGYRKGRVSLALQDNPKCLPTIIVDLAIQTHVLFKEMSSGMVRIALECEKQPDDEKTTRRRKKLKLKKRRKKSVELLDEPLWTVFFNGKKCGYGVKRVPGEEDLTMMALLNAVTTGAGVLPGKSEVDGPDGELAYMRVGFEHVVGSKDSQTLYLIGPDGGSNGPDLSIFFVRV